MMKSGIFKSIAAIAALLTLGLYSAAQAEWKSDRLYIEKQGDGAPVMIIPGLTSSPRAFEPAFAHVTAKNAAYHWATLGGFGDTPAPSDLSAFIAPVVDEVIRYLEEKDLKDVSVIGHSMGGVIALLAAAKSDRIGRVLVIDSVPFLAGLFNPGTTPEQAAAGRDEMIAQFSAMSDEQFTAYMKQGLPIQATSAEAQAIVSTDIERSDKTAVTIAIAELFSTDYRNLLPDIDAAVTVLVAHNAFTPSTPEQTGARYQALYDGLENATFTVITDARHFIQLDQPEAFAREVDLFLEE